MRKGLAKPLLAILARMCNNHFLNLAPTPPPFACTKLKTLPQKQIVRTKCYFIGKNTC